ncbi:acyl-CoA dehydrogenase [Bergeriella denitrificans]|uniref:Acyl-coenzyme A dehydrogenase n=1 Tax=Bergeriella denitrificans TaxID=494 RepID=A0A378UIR8_BERDE|nr:acyl-CoA dehydrogenase [Bergeriella denitrificans]STZ76589.1 Acyl-CoA dehydrogenase, short-chain specific [Bergeriella denitrificans]
MMEILIVLAAVAALSLFAAPLWLWAAAGAAMLLGGGLMMWLGLLWLAACAVLGAASLRVKLVSRPAFGLFKKILPPLSATEQAAVEAGTVWWEAEIFNGKPDWRKLQNYRDPKLTEEEQSFIDNETETLCAMLNDWRYTHRDKDLPPEVWQYVKEQGFIAMIIEKKYGGKQFSHYAHAKVATKIASRSPAAAYMIMLPNSLGPAELIQHYGTAEQKDYYLPRLAKGTDIPCFALTSPWAGSDAGAIPDTGTVCYGSYTDPRDGSRHENVLGVRVSFEKRWITMAPIATVIGLAFKLRDPEGLLGGKTDIGITCALLPTAMEGLHHRRRHYPNETPFWNGPVWGKDIFFPIDWIIGGQAYAGQGWRMLMECLSIGRCISLPSQSVGNAKHAAWTTSAWVGIRRQFGLPIGKFEGVGEALARIGAHTYQMEAAQDLALAGLDMGENPSVISAMVKFNNTERLRKVINDAMDIHGGRAVVGGPRNYLAAMYNAVPIGITVEGANILTRCLMIFGQGAYRCHNHVLNEIQALQNNDEAGFDRAFARHLKQSSSNAARSFVYGITGRGGRAPSGPLASAYKRANRLSAAFAFTADVAMLTLGGDLKRRESLSGRLADAFSNLYTASACLKRFEQEGSRQEDLPLAEYAVSLALYEAETALAGLVANLPNRLAAALLRVTVFPTGRRENAPADALAHQVSADMQQLGGTLERLTRFRFHPQAADDDLNEPLAALKPAWEAVRQTDRLEQMLRKAEAKGELTAATPSEKLDEAVEKELLTAEQADSIREARRLLKNAITVDDFDMELNAPNTDIFEKRVF